MALLPSLSNPTLTHPLTLSLAALASITLVYSLVRPSPPLSSAQSPKPLTKAISPPIPTPTSDRPTLPPTAYPPDAFPNPRDVESPYGSLRVYEWGPEEGRKVLLVHGITTPCMSLGGVARRLVARGCRVMLLDLWGRGYSSTPLALPQDTRLFTTAILLAITSSPLAWTGSETFSIVGYSLGGGIVTSFASYFPNMVNSLVLFAPAGLIREHHFTTANRILAWTGLLSETLVERAVERRLRKGHVQPSKVAKEDGVAAPLIAELPDEGGLEEAALEGESLQAAVKDAVVWQTDNHNGFIKAYVSSIRFGPITSQHEDWKRIGDRLTAQKVFKTETLKALGDLQNGKVLIILGKSDPVIIYDEVKADATDVLGVENVQFETCDVGHELPITKDKEVVDYMCKFWEME